MPTTIGFNINARRYINTKNGQFISEAIVRQQLDLLREAQLLEIRKDIAALNDSGNYDQFLTRTAKNLKTLWFAEYTVGRGGVAQMADTDYNFLNKQIQQQLTRTNDPLSGSNYGLLELVNQFESGEISQAQFSSRLKLYTKKSRLAYWQGKEARDNTEDLPYMQRELHGVNHCEECITYEALGVRPKGQLPLPTEACSCNANCNCTVEYLSDRQYKMWQKQQLQSLSEAVVLTS